MNGWQVQAMYEADSARLWEELNAPDPADGQMKEAAKEMDEGLKLIDTGLDWLSAAVASLMDTPMADKVQSILGDIENLSTELSMMKKHYERGERE